MKLTTSGVQIITENPKISTGNLCCQFHQHFRAHFSYKILVPKITKLKRNQRKLHNFLLYEKGARKMLMKLTPDLPFRNINLNFGHPQRSELWPVEDGPTPTKDPSSISGKSWAVTVRQLNRFDSFRRLNSLIESQKGQIRFVGVRGKIERIVDYAFHA